VYRHIFKRSNIGR